MYYEIVCQFSIVFEHLIEKTIQGAFQSDALNQSTNNATTRAMSKSPTDWVQL